MMEKQQLNNSRWLDVVETLAVVGSVGASVASLAINQVALAAIPLSLSVSLNLVNRRRLLNSVTQGNQTAIAELSQRSQEHQTNIKTLSEQLTGIQHSSIAQLLQQSQEYQISIKTLSEQMKEVQQLTTDLSNRNQELHDYTQSQAAKQKPLEEALRQLSELENLNQVIRTTPDDAEFYCQRGISFQDLGNKQKAIEDYNEAIRLDPYHALAYDKRSTVRSALGDKKGAIEDLRRATKLYFDQGDFVSYQRVKDLSKEVHDLSSHTKEKVSEKLKLGSLFS